MALDTRNPIVLSVDSEREKRRWNGSVHYSEDDFTALFPRFDMLIAALLSTFLSSVGCSWKLIACYSGTVVADVLLIFYFLLSFHILLFLRLSLFYVYFPFSLHCRIKKFVFVTRYTKINGTPVFYRAPKSSLVLLSSDFMDNSQCIHVLHAQPSTFLSLASGWCHRTRGIAMHFSCK